MNPSHLRLDKGSAMHAHNQILFSEEYPKTPQECTAEYLSFEWSQFQRTFCADSKVRTISVVQHSKQSHMKII